MALSLTTFAAASVVFATTNIDDIVLLAAFFGDPQMRRKAVVIGQFVGIGALTAVSAGAGYLALTVPAGWPALLGLIPLGLGVRKLIRWRKPVDGDGAPPLSGIAQRRAETTLRSQVVAVSAVTIANGGDNLGVYIPLFARDPSVIPVYGITFALLTAVWCGLGSAMVKHPVGAAVMRRWGHVVLPLALVAIGLHVLWGARVLLP